MKKKLVAYPRRHAFDPRFYERVHDDCRPHGAMVLYGFTPEHTPPPPPPESDQFTERGITFSELYYRVFFYSLSLFSSFFLT